MVSIQVWENILADVGLGILYPPRTWPPLPQPSPQRRSRRFQKRLVDLLERRGEYSWCGERGIHKNWGGTENCNGNHRKINTISDVCRNNALVKEDIGCCAHVNINIQYVSTLMDAHIYVFAYILNKPTHTLSQISFQHKPVIFFPSSFQGSPTVSGCKALPPRLAVGIVQVESSSLVDVLGATSTAPWAAMKWSWCLFCYVLELPPPTHPKGPWDWYIYLHENHKKINHSMLR